MKKLLKVVLAALMVLSLVACGGEAEKPATEDYKFKVVMLLPQLGDQSYFDTMKRGFDRAQAKHPEIKMDCIEVGMLGAEATCTEADWTNAYDEYCEGGEYDLVISANDTYEKFLYEAAHKYPEQMFLNCDASSIDTTCKNVISSQFGLDDLGYVVGALMSQLTKTKKVGVVVGMDNQVMSQWISGFCQVLTEKGVEYFVAYPNSWLDTALGKEVTEKMIDAGADVVWAVAGGLGNGVIEACAGHDDVWAVGVDQDQYAQFKESHPDWANTIITSALKNTDQVIETVVDWLADGTIQSHMGETKVWGIPDNGVGIAENEFYNKNVSDEIKASVAAILQDVKDGKVEVYDALLGETPESYKENWPAHFNANRIELTYRTAQ